MVSFEPRFKPSIHILLLRPAFIGARPPAAGAARSSREDSGRTEDATGLDAPLVRSGPGQSAGGCPGVPQKIYKFVEKK